MTERSSTPSPGTWGEAPIEIDITVPHAARVYDYLAGGVDNFEVDRIAAEQASEAYGGLEIASAGVIGNRAFLRRTVRYLAGEVGIRQFLDIGTGIPNADNVHGVAQQTAPDSRIVYVDNDPVVLAHSHRLLRSTPEGATAYLNADLRDPAKILQQVEPTLDLTQPVAVLLLAILHLMGAGDNPFEDVASLMEAVPSGSYLVVSHLTHEIQPEATTRFASRIDDSMVETMILRGHSEISRFFDGLELVEPGIVDIDSWRPDDQMPDAPEGWVSPVYGGVGRKP